MRLDARVRAYLAGPPLGGARMYAAPTPLAVGEGVPGGSLARKLDRLGYRPVGDPAHALAPGEYRAAGTTIEVAERPSPVSRGAGEHGGDPRPLGRLGVPGGRRRPPRPRFQRGGPGLLREAARRARAGRVRAPGGHHPLAERSLAAPPPARRARAPQPRARGHGAGRARQVGRRRGHGHAAQARAAPRAPRGRALRGGGGGARAAAAPAARRRVGARVWEPVNYDGTFAGTIPLEDALAESRNAATVRVALDVGLDAVARAAADLGIASPLPRVPALALGVAETSLLELTAAYGVFASGGVRRPPTLVVAVASADGETLYAAPPEEEHVIDPGVAYLVTHLLEGVVDRGTGRPARQAGLTGSAAGKTGTTDDTRDAWFVGFTPEVVAGVWVGLDGGGPTGLTGAQGALPIWTDFVRATRGEASEQDFPVPEDIVWRDVDPESGQR